VGKAEERSGKAEGKGKGKKWNRDIKHTCKFVQNSSSGKQIGGECVTLKKKKKRNKKKLTCKI
jgi:hypothetical protein